MDPVSLALSIPSLLSGLLNSYKSLHRRFRIFRHYSKDIKRICNRFDVQLCIFTNELHLLLIWLGRSDDVATAMLADAEHEGWTSQNFDRQLALLLGSDVTVYIDLLDDIRDQLLSLQEKLSCFNILKEQRLPDERMKDTMNRLKSAVRITVNKVHFEECIESLRQDNEDLRRICSYLAPLPKFPPPTAGVTSLPYDNQKTRVACNALYESIRDCWSCTNPDHTEHSAKLCLESHVDECVRLDLALSCSDSRPCTSPGKPLWLYVRTLTSGVERGVHVTSKGQNVVRQEDKRLAKRVKRESSPSLPVLKANLRLSPSLCDSLAGCSCSTGSENCLGFLECGAVEADVQMRQLFYHSCSKQPTIRSSAPTSTLVDALAHPHAISMEQQLDLARRLTMAVLSFHSTPWLPDQWRTRDISSFSVPSQDGALFLQTLHITKTISRKQDCMEICLTDSQQQQQQDNSSDTQQLKDLLELTDAQQAQLLHGVANISLFSLGIALLEIAHRQPLESFRATRDPNIIVTARRLVERPSIFGLKYQRLAKRCLQCDFGCGSDIDSTNLQNAVYSGIIGELDDMMAGFKL